MPGAVLFLDPASAVGPVNPRIFGSFVEHLGRCVYTGIWEPDHPTADKDGFRQDVIELVKELGVTTIRYPGGNFVSGFKWEDSVGPKADRPRRLDLAWHSTETNEIGLQEFATWVDKVDSELMYAINLGTRGTQEALDVLEYMNIGGGTTLSELRAAHGRPQPYDVRIWCLGNEMDGPWQLGHRSAEDYGKLAAQTARAMRQLDPGLELVVCGSSSAHMPTFGSWEHTVLKHTYEDVDYISCHAYYEQSGDDLGSFLASATDMDRFIESVISTADAVKAELGSRKTINISFDEWNVWYETRFREVEKITGIDNWPQAPPLLENIYNVADAVVVGNLLISLLKHADRVTSASLAQLVNVIAPIMTEPGGQAWRQTTFFPIATTARLARGTSLRPNLTVATYDTTAHGPVGLVDCAASYDERTGNVALFLVNRDIGRPTTVEVELPRFSTLRVAEAVTLHDEDPYASNTAANPRRVTPAANTTARLAQKRLSVTLPPISWTAISLVPDTAGTE
jgi:alpha-N-arabinofuranosidase